MIPQLPSAPPETILEWWLNRPAACLFAYAGLALFYALVAFGESLAVEPRPVRRSLRYRIRTRRISIGALHTAIWSLAGAVYLSLGPDVGVIPTDGPAWVAMAGLVFAGGLVHWAWADYPTISR